MDKKSLVIQRDLTIDTLRTISCLAVVLMHVVATFWYSTPVRYLSLDEYYNQQSSYLSYHGVLGFNSLGWYFCSFIDALTRFSVPCFVMISGALVLNKKEINFPYLKKKMGHVAKIILFWGMIIGGLTLVGSFFLHDNISVSSLLRIMVNGNGVFWFIYMLLPLYLASPIFKEVIDKRELAFLFCILWLTLSILLPFIKIVIPALANNVNLEYMSLFSAYTGYYVIGGYVYAHKGGAISFVNKYLILVFFTVFASLTIMTFLQPAGLWHNFTTPFCVCVSVIAFTLFLSYKPDGAYGKVVSSFAKQTMGIYGLHIFFLKMAKSLWAPSGELWYLQIVCYYIFVVVLCYILSRLLKIIPFLRDI